MKLKHLLRGLYWRVRHVGRPVHVHWLANVSLRSRLRIVGGGSLTIGAHTRIYEGALLLTYGGALELGEYCSVNPYCVLYGLGGLRIGNGVRIATHTVIVPANHTFDEPNTPIRLQPETRQGVVIEDDVWIGAGCRILDGVRIGRGCVVGAGAVVTRSLPERSVAVGVPARVVGQRGDAAPDPAGLDRA